MYLKNGGIHLDNKIPLSREADRDKQMIKKLQG